MNTTRSAASAILLTLTLLVTGCSLFPQEGEVREVEQEMDTTELTVYCNGESIDLDIPRTEEWEVGDIYGCVRKPEDQFTTDND